MSEPTIFDSPSESRHRAPLSEIRMSNFKSVQNASIQLRPLTAIVGRNSSGKSTLLQSVLAIAQAVQARSQAREFPLNGHKVTLGTFGEVRNFGATDGDPIVLGFTIRSSRRVPFLTRPQGSGWPELRMSWNAWLSSPPSVDTGHAEISALEVNTEWQRNGESIGRTDLDLAAIRGVGPSDMNSEGRSWPSNSRFDRLLRTEGRVTEFESEDGWFSRVDGISMFGGLPTNGYLLGTFFDVFATHWWDEHSKALEEELREYKIEFAELEVKPRPSNKAVKEAATDLSDAYEFEQDPRGIDLEPTFRPRFAGGSPSEDLFRFRASRLGGKARIAIAKSLVQLGEAEFRVRLRKELVDRPWLDDTTVTNATKESQNSLESGVRVAEMLFSEIRYLGPLRHDPKPNYAPGLGSTDLGLKGEYAAAVLHSESQAGRKVEMPLPDGTTRAGTPIGEALNWWLTELGLADRATATDRGRLGIGLTVSTMGSGRDVDLTSVGVGVSQALPVVLLCLLARPGTVVLLEQPELHLHPAMQLKMADFLLACARSGRQIIVETHSEHMINRLRRHVAEDESGENEELVRLLFAEQEAGNTTYRHSDINDLGGLDADWPKGFLDVAAEEAGELLRLNFRRRQTAERSERD